MILGELGDRSTAGGAAGEAESLAGGFFGCDGAMAAHLTGADALFRVGEDEGLAWN